MLSNTIESARLRFRYTLPRFIFAMTLPDFQRGKVFCVYVNIEILRDCECNNFAFKMKARVTIFAEEFQGVESIKHIFLVRTSCISLH